MCTDKKASCETVCTAAMCHSSFPVIHKVGNVGIVVMLKFENKINREISHFDCNL